MRGSHLFLEWLDEQHCHHAGGNECQHRRSRPDCIHTWPYGEAICFMNDDGMSSVLACRWWWMLHRRTRPDTCLTLRGSHVFCEWLDERCYRCGFVQACCWQNVFLLCRISWLGQLQFLLTELLSAHDHHTSCHRDCVKVQMTVPSSWMWLHSYFSCKASVMPQNSVLCNKHWIRTDIKFDTVSFTVACKAVLATTVL